MSVHRMDLSASSEVAEDVAEERVAQAIEHEIIFGQLSPGQKLREEDLAARYDASRHQVRQALVRLERIGIVSRERNRGAAVRSFSPDEVRQIYDIRELLQRQAALRIPLPAGEDDIALLTKIQNDYETAIAAGDVHQVHITNEIFHSTLFRLCRNEHLVQLVKQYMDLSYVIRANAFSDEENLKRSAREHNVMIALLRGTDSWALAQLCVDHIQLSKTHYLTKLSSPARIE